MVTLASTQVPSTRCPGFYGTDTCFQGDIQNQQVQKTMQVAMVGDLCFGTSVLMISLQGGWKSLSGERNRMHNRMETEEEMSHNQGDL